MKFKKGQVESIIYFFGIVIALFFLGFLLFKIIGTVLTPVASSIGNVSAQAGANVMFIQTKALGLWDTVIIALFIMNVILLFVSAFLVDVHPVFVILYIGAIIMLYLFGMPIMQTLDTYKTQLDTIGSPINMPITSFIIDNFGLVLLGVIVLSGILMYAKIKFFGSNQNVGGYY